MSYPPDVSTSTPTRRRMMRRYARLTALGAVFLAMLLGPVSAATAHDELAANSPATNSSVEVVPEDIVLTFSNPPSGLGATIIVSDETGATWSDGPTRIVNNTAVQPLRAGAPAGAYTVQWRVVSSDDHAIEGTYSFESTTTQDKPAPVEASPGAGSDITASPSTDASVSDSSEPVTSVQDAPPEAAPAADVSDSPSGLPTFVIFLGIGGILVAVLLAVMTRRLLNKR